MLDVKKLLTKVMSCLANPLSVVGVSWVTFNGSWTAPKSGLAVIRVQKNATTAQATFYLKDTTAGTVGVVYVNNYLPANFQVTNMFIAEKGHKYETEYTSNNFSGIYIRLYPWGGVFHKAYYVNRRKVAGVC